MRPRTRRFIYQCGLDRHHGSLLASLLVGIILAVTLICWVENRLSTALLPMATTRVNYVVSSALNSAIMEQLNAQHLNYHDIITTEKDANGQINALTSNMMALNYLRTSLSEYAVTSVDQLDVGGVDVPIGNLTGVNLLSGRGIHVPIQIVCVGTSSVEFQNTFTEAGINQTQHKIQIFMEVAVDILLPSETIRTYVSAEVPVAETVIIGSVPDTYLHMNLQ